MYRAVYAYAWDLVDAGLANVANDLAGAGINTISLACSYHAGKFLRPKGLSGKVYFPEDGTVYFRPRPDRYGKVQPQVNSLTAEHDVLAEICALDDMQANAWTVLLHNTRLGMAQPELTVRNAFGDPFFYSLCPANPDVREYAVTLCADLTEQYAVTGVSLETPGFLPFEHGYHHEFGLVRTNPWLNALLGLCFCSHCGNGMRSQGIDDAAVQRKVAAWIESYLASEVDVPDDMAVDWLLADAVTDGAFAALLRWRCDIVTTLVSEIRAAVRDDATVAIIPSVARPSGGAWYEGSDLQALATAAGVLEVPFYEPDLERLRADIWDVQRRVGEAGQLRGILRPGFPDLRNAQQVEAAVGIAVEAGIEDLAFYNYGHLRAASLRWMAAALAAQEG